MPQDKQVPACAGTPLAVSYPGPKVPFSTANRMRCQLSNRLVKKRKPTFDGECPSGGVVRLGTEEVRHD